MKRGVFLDRDGVLVEDVDLLTHSDQLRILPGVPGALTRLKLAGFCLLLVTNQTVVARGLVTEAEVGQVNERMQELLQAAGAPPLDGVYVCPHHPKATLAAYRIDCECRKPRPGLLCRAAREHGVDLAASFMVGDRLTDIVAGLRAGCRTVLVQTGRHDRPLIETSVILDASMQPDVTCADLSAAADWILRR